MRNSKTLSGAIAAGLLLLATTPVAAQVVVQSTFQVSPVRAFTIDVVGRPDGTMVFVFAESYPGNRMLARSFSPSGVFLGETLVAAATLADGTVAAVDARGEIAVGWRDAVKVDATHYLPVIHTVRLDATGHPVGKERQVNVDGVFANPPSIANLGAVSLLAWQQPEDDFGFFTRRYSSHGAPLGNAALVEAGGGQSDLIARRNGGYLVVYRVFGVPTTPVAMRAYTGSGVLQGSGVMTEGFDFSDAALADDESMAAAVGLRTADPNLPPNDVMLRRFTLAGTPLGTDILVQSSATGASRPEVVFDRFGNLLVVWGEDGGVWARVLDPSGVPIGASVQVSTTPVSQFGRDGIRTTRLANGNFASAWSDGIHTFANVITLCQPGSAMCGDGVHAITCEACDQGAANSDTDPDACRTDCRRAGCGDGVTDTGEDCDDGHTTSCDGCSATCALEAGSMCGDGVVSPGCEGCDDANAVAGDGCATDCTIERIRGGGTVTTDCYAEWRVDNAANEPLTTKRGGMNPQQRCVDDDPRCDFDGGVPGSCTFRVAVCANDTDIPSCEPGERLLSWAVTKPTATQAASRPALAAARAAFAGVASEIVGPGVNDLCSSDALVPVPLRGGPGAYRSGKLTLGGRAELYDHHVDTDKLKLTCLPATP